MPPLLHSPFTHSKYRVIEEEIFSLLSISTSSHHIFQIQAQLFTLGLHQNNFLATKLLHLCSSTSSISHASLLFHHISNPTISLWNAFIRFLSQKNLPFLTLQTYTQMKNTIIPPDHYTFPSLIKSCAALPPSPPIGPAVHGEIVRTGFISDRYVCNALIDMYSKHGFLDSAVHLFETMPVKDVVAWNSMVAGFFRREDVEKGRDLFERMPERNVVSWNTVVAGYARNGCATEALGLFRKMQSEGVQPNEVTLVGVLTACAQAGALEIGKWLHRFIKRSGIRMDIHLYNCLIDMYAKGGSLRDARQVFDGMGERNVVSWNAMIAGFAMHGFGEDAVWLFEEMEREGVEPNDITFIGVLTACAYAGLIREGCRYFSCMAEEYGITPKLEVRPILFRDLQWRPRTATVRKSDLVPVEGLKGDRERFKRMWMEVQHYGCMVDLFGRGGYVIEAHELIKSMPFSPDAGIWGALLGACQTHGYLELAEHAVICLLELEPWNAGNYVILSNIYAARGRWDDVEWLRKKMRGRNVQKTPGSSSIEVESSIHEFVVGDRSHPRTKEIYDKLEELGIQLKQAGYVPDLNLLLHDVCK